MYGPGANAITQPLVVHPVGLPLARTVNVPLPPLQLTIAPLLLFTAEAVIGLAAVKLNGTVWVPVYRTLSVTVAVKLPDPVVVGL